MWKRWKHPDGSEAGKSKGKMVKEVREWETDRHSCQAKCFDI